MTDKNFEKDINVPSKEIIIDGVDVSGCECYSAHREGYCGWHTPCEGDTCPYKLKWALQQLKAKEQECEAYKMEAEEGKEINAELKAENEELKEALNEGCLHNLTLITEKRVLLQTLTEIKEIAEKIANYYDGDEYELMRKDAEQILQKISECEV
jgi:hypothetical protein